MAELVESAELVEPAELVEMAESEELGIGKIINKCEVVWRFAQKRARFCLFCELLNTKGS